MKKLDFFFLSLIFFLTSVQNIVVAGNNNASDRLKTRINGNKKVYYTYNYPSVDAQGNPIVLSSALIAYKPNMANDVIETVLIGCHITITSTKQCPSEFPEDQSLTSETGVVYNFLPGASPSPYPSLGNCVIILPDYEGYGETSQRTHPYLAQELTSRQVVDAVNYGLALYRKEVELGEALDFSDDWLSFCYGYSQGGSVALATQRYIEQNNLSGQLHFAGSICGDGPYDLITTLRYFFEDDGNSYGVATEHRKDKISMPVVMPLIAQGMLAANTDMQNHQLTEYFSKKFLDTGIISWINKKTISTDDISKLLYTLCEEGLTAADGTVYTPREMQQLFTSHSIKAGGLLSSDKYYVTADLKEMMTPAFYAYFSNANNFSTVPAAQGDPMQYLHRALAENSLVEGWTPQHRIVFFHSKGDIVVPYGNYIEFERKHASPDIKIVNHTTEDHVDAGTAFYLQFMSSMPGHFKWIAEGHTPTGIRNINATTTKIADDHWYTTTGKKLLEKPKKKGVYIHRGEKVIH